MVGLFRDNLHRWSPQGQSLWRQSSWLVPLGTVSAVDHFGNSLYHWSLWGQFSFFGDSFYRWSLEGQFSSLVLLGTVFIVSVLVETLFIPLGTDFMFGPFQDSLHPFGNNLHPFGDGLHRWSLWRQSSFPWGQSEWVIPLGYSSIRPYRATCHKDNIQTSCSCSLESYDFGSIEGHCIKYGYQTKLYRIQKCNL